MKNLRSIATCLWFVGCDPSVVEETATRTDAGLFDASIADATNDVDQMPIEDASAELRGDGSSCDENAQCANGACLPSKNSFGSGVCFSLAMDGCVSITEPSPYFALCSSPSKRLYTCGTGVGSEPVVLPANCLFDIATGELGEHYHCCSTTFPIERCFLCPR